VAPIFMGDCANITVLGMRAKARRLKAKHGLGLVVVDCTQMIEPGRGRRTGRRK
jgi:replicative DNA helicase